MQIIERTKKQEKEYNKAKRMEKLKRNIALLKAKLFNKPISPDDSRTLQAHKDGQGNLRDYYVANPYLQEGTSFNCVTPIIEEINRYVYRGMVLGADNATGIIESNVPLEEIVASPSGNIKLQEMLSQENAVAARDRYYGKIGEPQGPLEKHSTHFGKPDFPLGTILKGEKGEYTISNVIALDIEEMLDREREEVKKDKSMRREDFVKIDLGNGVVVAEQDCWLEQGKGLKYAGINQDALLYEFSPEKQLQTKDKKYHVYIGDVQIGEGHKNSENSGEFNQYVRPYTYKDAVLWTEDNNLVQYFLNKKFDGLNFALGNIFANENIKRAMEKEKCGYMGGVTISAEGECKKSEKETPEAVKEVVEEYLTQRENRNEDKIIKFNGR